jgi:hypothetical protein
MPFPPASTLDSVHRSLSCKLPGSGHRKIRSAQRGKRTCEAVRCRDRVTAYADPTSRGSCAPEACRRWGSSLPPRYKSCSFVHRRRRPIGNALGRTRTPPTICAPVRTGNRALPPAYLLDGYVVATYGGAIVTRITKTGGPRSIRTLLGVGAGSCELRRMTLPRTPVNRGNSTLDYLSITSALSL